MNKTMIVAACLAALALGVIFGAGLAVRTEDNPHRLDSRGICRYCGLKN